MAEKKKRPQITSPRGSFVYPKLTKPDYGNEKFPKPKGEYNVRLRLQADAPETKALMAKLAPFMAEAEAAATEKFSALKVAARKKLEAAGGLSRNEFYAVIYDETTEEPTGEIDLKFKSQASGERTDGTKWTRKPGLFDAKMKPLPGHVEVWGGTVGKVSFEPDPYFVEGSGAWGVTLRLQAVQVLDLVSKGNRTAASYGFGAEDGFDGDDIAAPDADDATPSEKAAGGDEAVDDGNF